VASETLPLGDWEADRQSIKTTGIPDRGDISGLPTLVQFQVYVARRIRKWESTCNVETDQPAAFVLVTPDEYQAFKKAQQKEEPLLHTGLRRLAGRIHFVTVSVTRSIFEEITGDDSALFARLEAVGVGRHPTLIYVPQPPGSLLFFYPQGTSSDDGLTEVPVGVPEVSLESIEQAIGAVYENELITPDNAGPLKIWSSPTKRRPSKEAERGVQQLIHAGLAVKFAPYSIRKEQSGKVGRTDLEIVDDRTDQAGRVTHHALLELKVLRTRRETGARVGDSDTRQHITEGVDQANVYGTDKNSKLKLLCCFDMRDNDIGDSKTFSHVKTKAAGLEVYLRRWFLYHSSKAYRAAQS